MGRPRRLFPGGTQSKTYFGNLSSDILCTCLYQHNCLDMTSSTISFETFITWRILLLRTRSRLKMPADRRQKSISVALNISCVLFVKGHTSLP
ncbi:unnamed protein product [Bemisia tabaci]|uniref:Uncharacterized protein n=1 Tax=Bemisia tabaci TaxID=7038 RepID=A0A9P0A0E1_BEMTA|nr:unnamed protein product [Bemisia tabaci]